MTLGETTKTNLTCLEKRVYFIWYAGSIYLYILKLVFDLFCATYLLGRDARGAFVCFHPR